MKVKEIFYSLQGEGARTGRPAVFVRFAGCNLWSGREADRATAACRFCDTDFVGGVTYTAEDLADAAWALWPPHDCHGLRSGMVRPYVVLTGGEPMLQATEALVQLLRAKGFEVAIETNGTIPVNLSVDWITVSPKMGTPPAQTWGHELKVVVPQAGQHLFLYEHYRFEHFFVQPCDGAEGAQALAVRYCLERPQWRLSLQQHKAVGIR